MIKEYDEIPNTESVQTSCDYVQVKQNLNNK